jgi:hypothetical protein
MKKHSRNIFSAYTWEHGELWLFRVRKKNRGIFLTRAMAEEARMDYDFDKQSWYCYTKKCIRIIPEEDEFKSKVVMHNATGKWYVLNEYKDDKIVSDLYSTKKEALEVQKYLDSQRWSIPALNNQKRNKSTCSRRYSGIVPTKDGYVLMDSEKNQYGIYETLPEAEKERNSLRSRGISI